MRYEFKGQYVQVTAESADENVQLLQALGEVNPVSEQKVRKMRKGGGRKTGVNKEKMEILKKAIAAIPKDTPTFIADEVAQGSNHFPSLLGYYATEKLKRIPSYKRVAGGYTVTLS